MKKRSSKEQLNESRLVAFAVDQAANERLQEKALAEGKNPAAVTLEESRGSEMAQPISAQ